MSRASILAGLALACTAPSEPSREPVEPSDTAESTDPVELVADCVLDEANALRATCVIETEPPGEVQVRFAAADEAERVHGGDGSAARHEVGLFFMTSETPYDWVVERVDGAGVPVRGRFETGPLPEHARERWVVEGTSDAWAFAHVGVCDAAAMVVVTRAEDGATVWYERFPDADRFVGLEVTEDDTLLAVGSPGRVVERDWTGRELLRLDADADEVWHHDVTRKDGRTYVIAAQRLADDADEWRIDGVRVFGEGGVSLGRWGLEEQWWPSEAHPVWGTDVTHANSLRVGDDGTALVSLRHLSTVLEVVVDPDAEDFGEVRWSLTGADDADWDGDLELQGADGGFFEQHHATWIANGRLSLFDNGPLGTPSRALELEVDRDGGRAVVAASYEMDGHCAHQGASERTAGGHAVLTCGPPRRVKEFTTGASPEVVWTAEGSCRTGVSGVLPRMIPLLTP